MLPLRTQPASASRVSTMVTSLRRPVAAKYLPASVPDVMSEPMPMLSAQCVGYVGFGTFDASVGYGYCGNFGSGTVRALSIVGAKPVPVAPSAPRAPKPGEAGSNGSAPKTPHTWVSTKAPTGRFTVMSCVMIAFPGGASETEAGVPVSGAAYVAVTVNR